MDTCPNGCDLTYTDPYGSDAHYSRMIGIEVQSVYDGVIAWHCPDCGTIWPREGFEWAFESVSAYVQ